MLQVQPDIIYASDKYYTEADKKKISAYRHESNDLLFKRREAIIALEQGQGTEDTIADLDRRIKECLDKLDAIDGKAQLRYIKAIGGKDNKGNLKKLIQDAKGVIDQIIFSDFFIDYAVIMPADVKAEDQFKRLFLKQTSNIILNYCDEQIAAAEKYGLVDQLEKALLPLCDDKALHFLNDDIGGIENLLKLREDILKEYEALKKENKTKTQTRPAGNTIPALKKILKYHIPNNKVANKYTEIQDHLLDDPDGQQTMIFNTENVPVNVGNDKQGNIVASIVSLNYTGDLPTKLARLTPFDKVVLNTVTSLHFAGNTYITLNSIFKTMNGNIAKEPSKNQVEKMLKSLAKLNSIFIGINISNEIAAGWINLDELKQQLGLDQDEYITEYELKDRLLNFRPFKGKTNKGRYVEGIQILATPVLSVYSQVKKNKQLMTFPADMLNIEALSITDDVIVIKEYLAKELKQIQGKHRRNTILFDTLFKECELKTGNKTVAKRYRDNVFTILDEWKDREYITGYKIIGDRPIKGIEVYPSIKE